MKHLHKAQLVNVWRLQNSGEEDYTFYSAPHTVYSKIDYLLIPQQQLQAVTNSDIGNITRSGHAQVFTPDDPNH